MAMRARCRCGAGRASIACSRDRISPLSLYKTPGVLPQSRRPDLECAPSIRRHGKVMSKMNGSHDDGTATSRYVLDLREIDRSDAAIAGGKGANLGELLHID